jgi:hypothetical protein
MFLNGEIGEKRETMPFWQTAIYTRFAFVVLSECRAHGPTQEERVGGGLMKSIENNVDFVCFRVR